MGGFSELMSAGIPGLKVTVGGVLEAAATLLVCLIALRLLMRLFRSLLGRTKLEDRIQRYVLLALKLALYIVTAIIVMEALNIDATSLVALLSVASLGITLAAEDILGNVAGGLVLLSSHPFAIGDLIEADGVTGTVEEISLNRTRLLTADGLTVLVPNKTLSGSKVVNYTALGRRRIAWKVSASYDAPTETVKDACRLALSRTGDILPAPEPSVCLTGYGASAIDYTVYCWAAPEKYLAVYLALGEQLREAFAEKGVEMTYDHLNVHLLDRGQ